MVRAPERLLLLAPLVQGRLELLTQPLGVLPALVLGHTEQDSGSVRG
jgi:hypothetical protein